MYIYVSLPADFREHITNSVIDFVNVYSSTKSQRKWSFSQDA